MVIENESLIPLIVAPPLSVAANEPELTNVTVTVSPSSPVAGLTLAEPVAVIETV